MRFAVDFMNSATYPADADIGMRDWRKSRWVDGPFIQFKKDGRILLPGQPEFEAPLGRWIHVDVEFQLGHGRDENATWSISLSWEGGEVREFEIPLDSQFQSLTWTGVMAPADGPGVFYLDNLILDPRG